MIIAISGKSGSGKDTIATMIQYYNSGYFPNHTFEEFLTDIKKRNDYPKFLKYQIKKFADPLKDFICVLTGCTREQLEDESFKNSLLPDEWIRYGYADGFGNEYLSTGKKRTFMLNKQCSKEKYEEELRINWQTAYKQHLTYREFMIHIGNHFRDKVHEDIWVNPTLRDYNHNSKWVISDLRYLNEVKRLESLYAVTIRVNRDMEEKSFNSDISETQLDNHSFNFVVDNNDTIDELLEQVIKICKLINP